jgi:hypothetical protein
MANYVQPDYRVPAAPGVSVQVESERNPLNVSWPIAKFTQSGTGAPPAPVAGQLTTTSYGSIGVSGAVRADGSRIF